MKNIYSLYLGHLKYKQDDRKAKWIFKKEGGGHLKT